MTCVRHCARELFGGHDLPVEVIADFDTPDKGTGCRVQVFASGQRVSKCDPDPFVAVKSAFALLASSLVERLRIGAPGGAS